MRTLFHPFLPNGVSGDPVLWVDRMDQGRSLLLDLGDLHAVPARKLLRVDRALVTHTHLDHFVGFDQLLRLILGRERELCLCGPGGFLRNVEGRLAGYTWNLIADYPVSLRVEEIDGETVRSARYRGAGGLVAEPLPERPWTGCVHVGDGFRVDAALLDHGVPVLGYALREDEHLAVRKDRLEALGLEPGPWLAALKQAVRSGRQEVVQARALGGGTRTFPPGHIESEILLRVPGQTLVYLTDLAYTEHNIERVVALARGAQLMVCETVFLDADAALARERKHLTARQAGELARAAGVARLAPFHLSPRYEGREQELFDEAERAFGGAVVRLPPVATQDIGR